MSSSRRQFILGIGAAATAAALPVNLLGQTIKHSLNPAMGLSERPITAAASDIRFGYASITWNGQDVKAIEEISAAGFKGIQLRSNILKEFGDKPAALRDLLAQHKLTLVAFSSGGPNIDAPEADEIAMHVKNAKFVHDVGGLYLQVTDKRPKDRPIMAEDYKKLGRLITEIGKRSADLGVKLGYHNHMGDLGEKPEEVDWIMSAADPRYVGLELDIAHYQQGGGDPAKAARKYADRLLFLHIKDVESPVPDDTQHKYRFVELGRGKVDLPAFFATLKEIKFRGWAVIELDSVPDKTRTPKESALISKKYLEEKIGLSI